MLAPSRIFLSLLIPSFLLRAQFNQQQDLTVASGGVALSADGNTAVVGETADNNHIGGVRIFARVGGTWSQQGPELVGTNATPTQGEVDQGAAVAISGDGNTVAVGGPYDGGNFQGAVWVFARSGGVWTQQAKLAGNRSGVKPFEGTAVALSGDGNTLLMGSNNGSADGAYIFLRNNGTWSQTGGPLPGSTDCAIAVALSADGKTALLGCGDGAKVLVQSGGQWVEQALIGERPTVFAFIGSTVALSADGNTALLAGADYLDGRGAAAFYTRTNGVWTQQGGVITPSDEIRLDRPQPLFGTWAALSGDGNTAMITGPEDNGGIGATWVYTRTNGVWAEQPKIVVAGAGKVAAISTDNSTALLANSEAFVFVQPWYVTMAHPGDLSQGETGVPLTIRTGVQGRSGSGATISAVLPSAFTPTAISGPGWSCSLATLTCSRSDSLANGASYPPVTLTVNVNQSAPSQVTSTATVALGAAPIAVTTDTASVLAPFTDVSPTDPFLPAIDLLSSFGITSGCGATTYCPGDNITRGQMSVFVVRSVMGVRRFHIQQHAVFH